jgi:hypothetical protein
MVETAIDGVGNGFEIASLKTSCTQCWRQRLGLKTPISSGSVQPGFFSGSKIWQKPNFQKPIVFLKFQGRSKPRDVCDSNSETPNFL